MFVILLFCLLPSAGFAADLQNLVSASNVFEVAMIEHEQVLERSPSATELAASTLNYAKTRERFFVVLRKSPPFLLDMVFSCAARQSSALSFSISWGCSPPVRSQKD